MLLVLLMLYSITIY